MNNYMADFRRRINLENNDDINKIKLDIALHIDGYLRQREDEGENSIDPWLREFFGFFISFLSNVKANGVHEDDFIPCLDQCNENFEQIKKKIPSRIELIKALETIIPLITE